MKKLLLVMMSLLLVAGFAVAEGAQEPVQEPEGPVTIRLWTQEGESEGGFQFVQRLADEFMAQNELVTIEVTQKDTEALREDFQTASLAGDAPELLWTVNDHAGPFSIAGLIQPVGDLYDVDAFVESVLMEGEVWGVPIQSGNHLMLLYNKDLVPEPPETTDDLIEIGTALTDGETYGLVYNATEPFWLVPWLGGFGGRVFEEDGVTPSLNTQAMIDTLQFLHDLEFVHGIVPVESDYATMDALFKEGKAAMIINGDWSLGDYSAAFGDKLGVARIPEVSSTGMLPAPYTSGKYFMVAEGVSGATLSAIEDFIAYCTSEAKQMEMVETLSRLPARLSALNASSIQSDPILLGSSSQMAVGTPQPSVVEMRANWDAMKPEMLAVLSGSKTPAEAAQAMQEAAEAGVRAFQ